MSKNIFLLIMTFMMSSCATILTSSYDKITFSSSDGLPANVKVITPVEGERIITLPKTLSVRKRNATEKNYMKIEVFGDLLTEPSVQTFQPTAHPITILGLFIAPIIGPVIDLISQKGPTYGSDIVVNIKRKQAKENEYKDHDGSQSTVSTPIYSAPGSITGVKYE